jgi:hypothetical protein
VERACRLFFTAVRCSVFSSEGQIKLQLLEPGAFAFRTNNTDVSEDVVQFGGKAVTGYDFDVKTALQKRDGTALGDVRSCFLCNAIR